jgi:hypothetical protein
LELLCVDVEKIVVNRCSDAIIEEFFNKIVLDLIKLQEVFVDKVPSH